MCLGELHPPYIARFTQEQGTTGVSLRHFDEAGAQPARYMKANLVIERAEGLNKAAQSINVECVEPYVGAPNPRITITLSF